MASHSGSVGIIGAGAAGLITAHTLLQDGFDVQVLTRDKSPGGVWASERVYPGLFINNVHGEFRFSSLPMPAPPNAVESGGRLSGNDMRLYMEKFAEKFLEGKIRYETEVLNIHYDDISTLWIVQVLDKKYNASEVLKYSKIVLCTGGCSTPFIPKNLLPSQEENTVFRGLVLHSSQFNSKLGEILATVKPIPSGTSEESVGSVVVVGGGKSAQDIAAYLANQGRKVSMVFETTDAFIAASTPLPDMIRKSRFLAIFSPHIHLRTRLERFLHTTWLGGKIVNFIWNAITQSSFRAMNIPKHSPLRRAHSIFWGVRTNDDGVWRGNCFQALVNAGKIILEAPARVSDFHRDGYSVILDNGKILPANVVICATGYSSSWTTLFTAKTTNDLGLARHPPNTDPSHIWKYTTLENPPPSHPDNQKWATSIYRGLVPAKSINRRNFAINGAISTTNNGYVFEVSAHWISSYFMGDKMCLPSSPEEASACTARNSAWMRLRYPDMLLWANESYGSVLAFWNWPQIVDEMLDDMGLPSLRSGGNWLSWPFRVLDLREIATLTEERRVKRSRGTAKV